MEDVYPKTDCIWGRRFNLFLTDLVNETPLTTAALRTYKIYKRRVLG
jgi:hypothetical protein